MTVQDNEGIKRKFQKTKNHKKIYDELRETMEAVRKGRLKDRRETENFLKDLKDRLENSLLQVMAVAS